MAKKQNHLFVLPTYGGFISLGTVLCFLACVLSRSVLSGSLQCYGLQPARLCRPGDSPGKNSGVGCQVLL